jgi:Ca2+-binding RTX toxin-like protein
VDDFAGPGGWTSAGASATGRTTLTILNNDLARFLGTGTMALGLDSTGSGTLSGTTANLLAQLQARGGAEVDVRYTYLPPDPTHVVGGPGATIYYGNYSTDGDVSIFVGAGGKLIFNGALAARNVSIDVGMDGSLEQTGGSISATSISSRSEGGQTGLAIPVVAATGVSTATVQSTPWIGVAAGPPVGHLGDIMPSAGCMVVDTRTNQPLYLAPAAYAGPVALLEHELVRITGENLNVAPATDNWFIRTGDGTDAIAAHGGTDVLDGGGGSNFLTGAAGRDTFFLDARAAADDIWSTIAAFGSGDAVTIWGLNDSGTTLTWLDGQGAPGATGLTLHASTAGQPAMAVTLAGYSSTDLTNGHLAVAYGHDAASGSDYLYLAAL